MAGRGDWAGDRQVTEVDRAAGRAAPDGAAAGPSTGPGDGQSGRRAGGRGGGHFGRQHGRWSAGTRQTGPPLLPPGRAKSLERSRSRFGHRGHRARPGRRGPRPFFPRPRRHFDHDNACPGSYPPPLQTAPAGAATTAPVPEQDRNLPALPSSRRPPSALMDLQRLNAAKAPGFSLTDQHGRVGLVGQPSGGRLWCCRFSTPPATTYAPYSSGAVSGRRGPRPRCRPGGRADRQYRPAGAERRVRPGQLKRPAAPSPVDMVLPYRRLCPGSTPCGAPTGSPSMSSATPASCHIMISCTSSTLPAGCVSGPPRSQTRAPRAFSAFPWH